MPEAAQMDIEEVAPARKPRTKAAEIVKVDATANAAITSPGSDTAAILGMIERIMVDPNASVERATQAFEFYQRVQAEAARRSFDDAVAKAKAIIKPIARNSKGHNDKKYADFSAIAKAVDPILGPLGLSYRFRSEQSDNRISVTCRLSHKDGHAEETTLSGPADTTGNKNAMQAIGSTTTYLQRYTLVLMLGLSASNDDDGQSAEGDGPISDEQINELIALADEVGADKAKFCKFAKVDSFADIYRSKFDKAKAALKNYGRQQ